MAAADFKQFDVVTDFSDHYYAKTLSKNPNLSSNSTTALSKKIMREWKILKKNLPENIFVHAYESRIDLLRAVIIGAPGTPYHDGLYFFDIQFPDNYPNSPPNVRYKSFGLRINPNLYNDGLVCLSLLNTWIGKRNEKWDPSSSTILQVLVSIQGLVLNEKPYYNEPWVKPSLSWYSYNEKVFFLCCKSTLYLLKNPPTNFLGFVNKHFENRGRYILRACRAYVFGFASVGYLQNDGPDFDVLKKTGKQDKIKTSLWFRMKMYEVYPLMFQEFTRIGAFLEGIPEDLKKIADEKKKKKKKSKNKESRFGFSRMIFKFKSWFKREREGK